MGQSGGEAEGALRGYDFNLCEQHTALLLRELETRTIPKAVDGRETFQVAFDNAMMRMAFYASFQGILTADLCASLNPGPNCMVCVLDAHHSAHCDDPECTMKQGEGLGEIVFSSVADVLLRRLVHAGKMTVPA